MKLLVVFSCDKCPYLAVSDNGVDYCIAKSQEIKSLFTSDGKFPIDCPLPEYNKLLDLIDNYLIYCEAKQQVKESPFSFFEWIEIEIEGRKDYRDKHSLNT